MGGLFCLYCFLSLLLSASSLHSSAPASLTAPTPQLSFLQSQIRQSAILVTRPKAPTPSADPLMYIKDEDDRVAVAIDYADAKAYAESHEDCEDQDELVGLQPTPYMVGDLFDNGRSDTSKLQINAQSPGELLTWGDYSSRERRDTSSDYLLQARDIGIRDREMFEDMDEVYQFDLGDVTQLGDRDDLLVESEDRTRLISLQLAGTVNRVQGDRLEYTDKDDISTLYSEDGYEGLVGDRTDNALSDEVPLTLRRILGQRQSNVPSGPGPAYDLDDWRVVGEGGNVTLVNKDVRLVVRTQDLPGDIDPKQVYLQGRRYVQSDRDEVPVFYSPDPSTSMVGDLYSNKRTDATPLQSVIQPRINPLSWFRAPTTVVVQTPQEVPSRRSVQVQERDYRVERQDLDDMRVEEVLGKLEAYPLIPMYADNATETYMVGDMFPNKRTDNAKLEVLRLSPTPLPQATDTPTPPTKRDYDLDEVHNVYLNSTWADIDTDELIIAPEAPDSAENDQDELLFTSPTAYMTGDMFDNSRSDSSRLSPRVERPTQPQNLTKSIPSIDIYRITEYIVPASEAQVNTTEDSNEIQAFKRIEENRSFRQALSQAEIQQGIRLAMVDLDDTPVLFSSDSRDYVGGDLFANDRSDTSKLRVVLKSATLTSLLRWSDMDDDDWPDSRKVANPGFLQ